MKTLLSTLILICAWTGMLAQEFVQQVQIPTYFRAGYPNTIFGHFDGIQSNTIATLNGESLNIIDESTNSLVFEMIPNISGEHMLVIEDAEFNFESSITVIDLVIGVGKMNLIRGETTQLDLQLNGVSHTNSEIYLELKNTTPNTINLEGGNHQMITVDPNIVNSDNYQQRLDISSTQSGGFGISANLIATNQYQGIQSNPNSDIPQNPIVNPEFEFFPDNNSAVQNFNAPNPVNFTVVLPTEDIQEERNKARDIPSSTPLTPRDPDDKDKPYSRPVPPGIKGDKGYDGKTWPDKESIGEYIEKEVSRAKKHKGKPKTGVPGYGHSGILSPAETTSSTSKGVKCTTEVYYLRQRYSYLNDRTLLFEEQLSPSYEFFVAEGKSKIDVTETETGWEVSAKATAGKGPVEVEVSGKYWEKTTKIKGKGSSSLKGRHLWLFHVGRLYLVRKAFILVTYKYTYEYCDDGTSKNSVDVSYSDNWHYWYQWEEELFVASKDDEGNFHRVDAFPDTRNTSEHGHTSEKYDMDNMKDGPHRSPSGENFFPNK